MKKSQKGITLIALVITIIILLILAGVALNLTIGENSIFELAWNAVEKYENEAEKEQNLMAQVDDYIANFRNPEEKSHITLIFDGSSKEIDCTSLGYTLTNYDLVIVYYSNLNSEGSITFDTLETKQYKTCYTYSTNYVFGDIKLDIENNKITDTVSKNYSSWDTNITRVIGVKL